MANPVLVFSVVWGSVLMLYLIGATDNLVPVSSLGIVLVLLNVLSIVIIYMLFMFGRRTMVTNDAGKLNYINSARVYSKVLLFFWFIGTCFEVYIQNGFPLYWNIVGDGRLYTDFGIPSFHGIMNAMYLQAVTALAYIYFGSPKKRYIAIISILLCWPVMMLGRGIMLSAIIQIVAVFLLTRQLTPKAVTTIVLSALAAVLSLIHI